MTNVIYRFYLQINEDGEKTLAHPIWKADTSIEESLESSYKFFRKGLSNKIDFILTDYDFIMSSAFDDTIYLYIEGSEDYGQNYTEIYVGKFVRTDCTINYDDKKISVQPVVHDSYNIILEGIDKEFDLIKLAPELCQVSLQKRPMIQVYDVWLTGAGSCFMNGANWDVEVDDPSYSLIDYYHFGVNYMEVQVTITCDDMPEIEGTYTATGYTEGQYIFYLYNDDISDYRVFYELPTYDDGRMRIEVQDTTNNNTRIYQYYGTGTNKDVMLYKSDLTHSYAYASNEAWGFYTRLIFDNPTPVDGVDVYEIPSDDIFGDNDYKYCIPFSRRCVFFSENKSSDPTEWGQDENGMYYLPPDSEDLSNTYGIYPICKSKWDKYSYWFAFPLTYDSFDYYYRQPRYLRDAYRLSSCISKLLAEMGSSVTHEATTDYSEFLYDTTNPLGVTQFTLLLTQMTNITRGEYTIPAQKAPTTLSAILKMLQNCFGLYWFVDSSDRLRIEHITWFKNGGSYTDDVRTTGWDLTTMLNIKNGKAWGFQKNEVTFDKFDLASKYQYKWATDCTEPFQGKAIEIVSNYVSKEKTEEITIGGFSSDVDYLQLNGQNLGNDGLIVMGAIPMNLVKESSVSLTADTNTDVELLAPIVNGNEYTITFTVTDATDLWVYFMFADDENEGWTWYYGNLTAGTYTYTEQNYASDVTFIRFISNDVDATITDLSITSDNVYTLPFLDYTDADNYNEKLSLQNGYCSFWYLQQNFLLDDMPARDIVVNGVATTASGVQRKKKQEVRFPANTLTFDPNCLIKTSVGFGQVEKISLNLSSRVIKATLNYETDS